MADTSTTIGEAHRHAIAIVGMAGQFPGAPTVAGFWSNLCAGVESIRPVTADDLVAEGLRPALLDEPAYVAMCAPLDDAECFDSALFGYHPKEAELIDPQQRVLLECAWAALEDSGYGATNGDLLVGVFAGVARNTYLPWVLAARPDLVRAAGDYQMMIAAEKDFPATRIGYKLDLRGPCVNVQTACSTSGVAIHLACQSLLTGDCDVALAGGARVMSPHRAGYTFDDGGILSPDGHCRAFDASAGGTIRGNGAAFVVLRRYEDAVADGDTVHALIRGTAINNDGAAKVGFTAPSVQGQSAVIADALSVAGIDADSIGYVEAHGTGTSVGDPIEVAALTRAFRASATGTAFCGIGSLKTNIGHLDAAAAVAGLIKATLAVKHGRIPPSLHFREPNPQIDFDGSPFFVVDRLREWRTEGPRRAGVSSFGLGGTNVHLVIEQAPEPPPSSPSRDAELLVLSARTPAALDVAAGNLAAHIANDGADLGDVAYTLQTGRRRQPHRLAVAARSAEEAVDVLIGRRRAERTVARGPEHASLVFMFPGGGAQHPGMGSELYATEPVYREHLDLCLGHLRERSGIDLTAALLPGHDTGAGEAANDVGRPSRALPALLSVEVSLARLLMSWGLEPDAMIGHSLGEYAAAHLAGVLSLEDALALVVERGRLFEVAPAGAMLSVPLPEAELRARFPDLSIAAVNGPDLCVLSGETDRIEEAQRTLARDDIDYSRLHISVPAHSEVLAPILADFAEFVSAVPLSPPRIPFVSNVTGEWIRAEEATDPDYWVRHLRRTVRFDDGLARILEQGGRAILEVGPGRSLAGLARQHTRRDGALVITPSMRHATEDTSDAVTLAGAVGKLWTAGLEIDWPALHAGTRRRRVPLPTYPFERTRHWIRPDAATRESPPDAPTVAHAPIARETAPAGENALAQANGHGRGNELARGTELAPENERAQETGEAPDAAARVLSRIKQIFGELSGLGADGIDEHLTFLELGFESLSLTQGSTAVKRELGVQVSFRALLDSLSTPALLAEHVRNALPAAEAALVSRLPAAPDPRPSAPTPMDRGSTNGATLIKGPWRPIDKSEADGLDDRRSQHIADLVARLCARTRESKRWTQRNRARLADPRTVAGFRRTWKELVYPLVVTRSAGSRVWDLDGNEYIDVAMGFGVNLFGHSPAFITDAVRKRLDQGVEIGPQTPLAGEVAHLIGDFTGHERVAFANTGSEAVLAAIRMARTVTGRTKIVTFEGDYHGIFDEVLARPVSSNGHPRSVPIAPGIPNHMVDSIVVLPYGDPSSLARIEEMAADLAVVLVEPVQSRHPDLQPVEFLRSLRAVTERVKTPLVFDEMITGFRCHPGGAQELFGVRADLATYGKVIGGGFPIGVVAGRAQYMDALDGGAWSFGDDSFPEVGVTWFAGTFVRHPVALTAARAALTHMAQSGPSLQQELNRSTSELVAELNAYYGSIGAPLRIEHFSSFFLLKFEAGGEFSSLFYHHLRDQGVHITEGRSAFLSTAHSEADLEHLLEAFKTSARALQEGGFLPGGAEAEGRASPAPEKAPVHVPITEGQEEIWLAATAGGGAECAFNLSNRLELRGELDVDCMAAALDDLVARHEALRTTFTADGRLMVVAATGRMALRRVDLGSSADAAHELDELAREDVETPLDLVSGPLARATLIRLTTDHHVLFLTVHHIICDGWSCGVLLRDLGAMYEARTEGRAAELAPPMQISAYARRQEGRQGTPETTETERYWLGRFEDGVPELELPTDYQRPALKTYVAAREEAALSSGLVQALSTVARGNGCTLFTVLLSAFEVFLARLTRQADFVVGVSVAGQLATGHPDLVAHCVNLLPVRTTVDLAGTFDEHLRSTRARVLDSLERQEFTFGTLLKKLRLRRDPSRVPVVSVVFNMDSAMTGLTFPGLTTASGSNPRSFENFELFVNVVTTDVGTRIECTYNTDLFSPETIRRRLEEFVVLLSGAASSPRAELRSLPGLTEEERDTLLVRWNATDLPVPVASVAERVGCWADADPDRTAVGCWDRHLTYADLWARAGRVARHLRERDVGRGAIVGVSMERVPEMVVALMGVWRSGAAYLPLDPEFPPDRLSFMVADSGARLVLTDGRSRSSPWDTETISLADAERLGRASQGSEGDDEGTAVPIEPHDLAYVLYTSGSTGRPKGVEVEHGNLTNFLASMASEPGLTDDDVLLAVTTLSFDIAGLELWLPLWVGARVEIAGRDEIHAGELLRERLDETGTTVMQATPSTWRMLLEAGWSGRLAKILCGGEPFPRDLVGPLLERADEVWNLYGPTETTIWSTAHRVRGADAIGVPIGRPIANTRVYVMDPHGGLAAQGVPGELWIGGRGVTRGYHDRDDLTADRFVADPFGGGARAYRTGDLVRWRNDGLLEHLGRLDDQVKVHGHRIELGEIEAMLAQHDDVRQAVAAVKGREGDARLVAFVVSEPGRPVIGSELRRFLRQRLPVYMVPGVISEIDVVPLGPNGKVDRKALPDPVAGAARPEYAPPRTAIEKRIADIWRTLLDVERVSVHDNFFELGGHSLLAMRAANMLAETSGSRIDPRTLFFQTLQQVAATGQVRS